MEQRIDFISTPFDAASLSFLADDLDLPVLKLSSGEIDNAQLLLLAGKTKKDIILSTGTADLSEIKTALAIIGFGLADIAAEPCLRNFLSSYDLPLTQRLLQEKVTVLHCTSEYPAPETEVNLLALKTLQTAFGLKTGFSDHSKGDLAAVAAVALGARVIEKHFTLDKNMPGPDHQASLDFEELREMIAKIRLTEKLLGTGIKQAASAEKSNKGIIRKSLVARKPIAQGEKYSLDNLTVKRPGNGVPALYYWDYIGSEAKEDYQPEEQVK